MTTYRTLRIPTPYAQRLLKWAGLGCLAWLLWPVCPVRADQTLDRSWPDPLVATPSHDAQALAQDYRLSWGAALPVLPTFPDQPVAQGEATNGQKPDGMTEGEDADLARQSQNPVANLISVPFQNNTNVGLGQFDRTGNTLNIQPVLPTPLSQDLLLINRVILPLAYQPELAPGVGNSFGLGDIFYQGFLSPVTTGNFSWGIGPAIAFPTATDRGLGTGKWSIGPAAVGIWSVDRIVAGALVNNVWSFAGDGDRQDVSALTDPCLGVI